MGSKVGKHLIGQQQGRKKTTRCVARNWKAANTVTKRKGETEEYRLRLSGAILSFRLHHGHIGLS